MAPKPMKCGTALTSGQCEELLTITGIQYVYDREPVEGESSGYNLNEVHYNAVCPNCGERKLIEKPTSD
jgi:rubredoxin